MRVNSIIIHALLHVTQGLTTENSIPFQSRKPLCFKHVVVHYSIYKPLQNPTTCTYNNVIYSKINLQMLIERQNIQ